MDTVDVTGVACPCPDTPHPEGDTVTLRGRLNLAGGTALQTIIVQANQRKLETAEVAGQLAEEYLRVGIVAWTFIDARGKPVPVTSDAIAELLLSDFTRAMPVADKADDLYSAAVLGPLVNGAATSSPTTPTASSTSRTGSGSRKNRKQSRRSSTSTTPTVAIATTS